MTITYITTGNDDDTVIQPADRNTENIKTNGGNDTINAGLGTNDNVDGGTGIDHLIIDWSVGDTGGGMVFSNVSPTFGSAYRAKGVGSIGSLDSIQFSNIEQFTVIGTSKDDTIKTYYGTNTIQAGAGNDTVIANAGTLDGGSGLDFLTLDLSKQTANLNLSNLSNIIAPGVTAINFERFAITTGSGNDTIIQTGIVNGDVLRASDTINTGAGNDTINAGLGTNDNVDGGTGIDHLILDYSVGDTGGGMVFNNVSPTFGSASRSNGVSGLSLDSIQFRNIEQFTVIGTSKNDTIKTYYGTNIIQAGAGDDTVIANAGTLDGGSGLDFLTLDLSKQTANLNLSNLSNIIAPGVTATNFERFAITTGSGNDIVTQSGIVNGAVLRANDIIKTGAGNDTINAGLGSDSVDGGTGIDHLILDYSFGDTGTGISFYNGNPTSGSAYRYSGVGSNRFLDYISFNNIEQFTVIGTSKDDTITTYYGTNNIIQAGAGNDHVTAIAGNLSGTLDGGSGFDYLTLDLSKQTANINLSNLSNISVAGITATNFERFAITTGSGNDIVTQSGIVNSAVLRASDTINTGAGNDIINAGLGGTSYSDADVVNGGAGIDHLIVDYSVGDTGTGMTFNALCFTPYAYRNVSSTNSTKLDYIRFYNIEEFTVIGTSKNDTIKTGAGNDIINAGAGNDTITGYLGGDTLTGGTGVDTFNYGSRTDSLLANYDVITDLAIGTDVIDGPRAVSASQLQELTNVTALTETAIQQVLTTTDFRAYGAATFSFGERTFLGINDRIAGFSASTDSIIEITGFTGNLTDLAIV